MHAVLEEHFVGVDARRDDAVVDHGLLDDVYVRQVLARDQPHDVARVVDVIAGRGPAGREVVLLAVGVPDGAVAARRVGRGHQVVAAGVDIHAVSRVVGIALVLVELRVEPVPPVEMILGQVGLPVLSVRLPGARHQEVALHGRHGRVRPACAPALFLDAGDVVLAAHVPEVERTGQLGRGRCRGRGDGENQHGGERDPSYGARRPWCGAGRLRCGT